MQAGEAADVADWQQLQQAFEPDAQALGQTRRRLQPVDPLGHPPTAQAIDAAHRQLQQNALIQQVTITHLANPPLVDQRTGLTTAPAGGTEPACGSSSISRVSWADWRQTMTS